MKRNLRHWSIGSLIVVVALLLVSTVQAEEITVKSRAITHMTKVEVVPVGDVKGHAIGTVTRSGLTIFENGDVATRATKTTFDSTKGSGTHRGYTLHKFEDGSTYVSKFQGTHTTIGGGKNTYKGTFEYASGTGRFEGIKGSGTYTGKRYRPGKEGGDNITDITGTYTLPSK